MSTLAQIRDRVEMTLLDVTNTIFGTALIDECIKQALDLYNAYNPLGKETVLTLPGDGREIAIDSLSGLVQVTEVWWPYDSLATSETWPPNRVRGWRVYWDYGLPVLFLEIDDASSMTSGQPQTDDEVRIWYTAKHEIEGLDSAAATTLISEHESILVAGAAGHAAMSRALDLVETAGTDLYAVGMLATWGRAKRKDFNAMLKQVRETSARSGRPWGAGWDLDKWDASRGYR